MKDKFFIITCQHPLVVPSVPGFDNYQIPTERTIMGYRKLRRKVHVFLPLSVSIESIQ